MAVINGKILHHKTFMQTIDSQAVNVVRTG